MLEIPLGKIDNEQGWGLHGWPEAMSYAAAISNANNRAAELSAACTVESTAANL